MLGNLKSIFFEEAPKAKEPVASLPLTDTSAPAMFVPGNDSLYQQLVGATQFEKTAVGQILSKYLAPLATLPLPTEMKLKTAAAQAQSLDGVLPSAIIGAYDELKQALITETANFEREAGEYEKVELTQRQEKMDAIQADIVALQQKLLDTQQSLASETTELQKAQAIHSQMKMQFNMALQRRTAEVEQEKVKTSAIVNG